MPKPETGGRGPARRIAPLYGPARGLRHYVEWKLRLDPVFPCLVEIFRPRRQPILDVGCGVGLFAASLRVGGVATPVFGFDLEPRKIADAQRALLPGFPNLAFAVGDATAPPAFQGDVVALDVLHYLPAARQIPALRAWADRVTPGGWLVMRTPLHETGWRARATQVEEWFIRASGWVRTRGVSFPRREILLAALRDAGLTVELRPLWGRTPFNGHLLIAGRSEG